VKSFRLPPPATAGAPNIELDIFQGDSEFIVDNEYLGTVRVPAAAAGRKIDFRLDEECLLKVVVEDPAGPKEIQLATRDTPETLKKALEEELARQAQGGGPTMPAGQRGFISKFRKILGGE
jgi:molecular chaperone DnaK